MQLEQGCIHIIGERSQVLYSWENDDILGRKDDISSSFKVTAGAMFTDAKFEIYDPELIKDDIFILIFNTSRICDQDEVIYSLRVGPISTNSANKDELL